MSNEEILGVQEDVNEFTSPLDQFDFNELKALAKMQGIKAEATWKKIDFVTALKAGFEEVIKAKVVKAEEAKNAPPAGYARVLFNKDSTPGASNRSVFLGLNGRIMQAPRGILCDIPIPYLDIIDNSKNVHTQNTNPNAADARSEKFEEIETTSYSYSLRGITPGPFVNPNDQRANHYKQRHYAAHKYGHWPTGAEFKSMMDRGIFDTAEFKGYVIPEL